MTSQPGTREAFGALADALTDIARVVSQISPDEYVSSGVPGISGSIGGHVRHVLDHVLALERGIACGVVDYDTRHRQTPVERDREIAVLALAAAARRLMDQSGQVQDRRLVVRATVHVDGAALEGQSTLARELTFVISHTIHHSAQIALLVHRQGRDRFPDRFGVAPATPAIAGAA